MIHVSRDGQQFGPYTQEDAQAYLADGSLLATDLGWTEGSAEWVPLPQLVGGGEGVPPLGPGTGCPKCGAGLESNQVICLSCGHNVDEPVADQETVPVAPVEKRKVPPSLTYEDEMADRSSFVNSVGWGLLMASLMPVFGDGQWNIPFWKFWELEEWQMMFEIVAPGVVGGIMIALATAVHGRARGVAVVSMGIIFCGMMFADGKIGGLEVFVPVEDTSEPIPEPLSGDAYGNISDLPVKKIELESKNVFYEKMGFSPGNNATSMAVFFVAWLALMIGAKARYYRIQNLTAYIISLIGAVAMLVFWFFPGESGMPVMAVVDSLSNNLLLGVGLLAMMAMQLGAAVFCFMNGMGKRPSQMKNFANRAVMLMVVSLVVPVLPVWGNVIYEEVKNDHERSKQRREYVASNFGQIWTGQQQGEKDIVMNRYEKPVTAAVGATCGWLMTGVKYVSWIGGLLVLLPLGVIEIICGTREQDEGFIVQQQ